MVDNQPVELVSGMSENCVETKPKLQVGTRLEGNGTHLMGTGTRKMLSAARSSGRNRGFVITLLKPGAKMEILGTITKYGKPKRKFRVSPERDNLSSQP